MTGEKQLPRDFERSNIRITPVFEETLTAPPRDQRAAQQVLSSRRVESPRDQRAALQALSSEEVLFQGETRAELLQRQSPTERGLLQQYQNSLNVEAMQRAMHASQLEAAIQREEQAVLARHQNMTQT